MANAEGPYTEQFHPAFRTALVRELETVPPYRVRVNFPDRDNMVSYWLPVVLPKTGADKFFWQPDLGDLVKVTMDEHDEDGAVIGSLPNTADGMPEGLGPGIFYIAWKDGTVIQYNRDTHLLQIALGAGGSLALSQPAGGKLTMDAGGNLALTGAQSISFSQAGAAAEDLLPLVSKLIAAFNLHTHGDPPTTGTPTTPWTADTVASDALKVSN